MHFPDPICVVIPRPLLHAVRDRPMLPFDLLVSAPLVSMDRCFAVRVAVNVGYQGLLVGVFDNPQPYPSRFPAHAPDYRRAVVLVCAVASSLVGAPPRRIIGIGMPITFFPPRSETSRRSRHAHPSEVSPAGVRGHFRGAPCAGSG